jgi:hypothetical protein
MFCYVLFNVIFIFYFRMCVLLLKPRASCLLDKCSTTELNPQPICFFCFVLEAILGIELRALYFLGRRSTTSASPSALYVLVIFEIGYFFMPGLA